MTTVNEVMTRRVRTLTSTDTVALAAQAMDELNVGAIPVCESNKLLGMVTDRDIVVRAVAQGLDARTTPLSHVMSANVRTARENDDLDQILSEMSASQVRRLPVVDDANRLIGIVSIGDIATQGQDEENVGQSLRDISSPAESDRSAA